MSSKDNSTDVSIVSKTAESVSAQTVCTDLAGFVKFYKSHTADFAEAHGLTPIQLYALHSLNQNGDTMGGLAQTLHCDASNVTGIVDRLSALQLIMRQENPQDRRVKSLQLTQKGQQVITAINKEMPSRLNCTLLTASERLTLHQLIKKLNPIKN